MTSKATIYQLLPRYWGNKKQGSIVSGSLKENGSGRLDDIDDNSLEYLKWLGISHVWYTGVVRHAVGQSLAEDVDGVRKYDEYDVRPEYVKGLAGSPYAISDYYKVNPYLAAPDQDPMEAFEALLKRTHSHGLKAIIDFIPNHVSPCYKDDFGGIPTHPWCDYDWTDTRKIDYSASGATVWDGQRSVSLTWMKLYDILRFWALKGVDGFRCDMVELVPPEFFAWAIAKLKAEFPGLIFVAEVYNMDSYRRYIKEVGFDLLYDKSGLYDSLFRIYRQGGSAEQITWNWQRLGDIQGDMLNFIENHDEKRAASEHFAGNGQRALAALAVSALLNDASLMIYEGQEIGERGLEHAGFSGPDGRSTIYDWWSIESLALLNKIAKSKAYNEGGAGPLVQEGMSVREASLLNRYKSLMDLRASLRPGNYDLGYCNDFDKSRIYSFVRCDRDGNALLITVNFSDEKKRIDVHVPDDAFRCLASKSPEKNTFRLTVPAWDFSFIDLN